jgi:hypothetical protein
MTHFANILKLITESEGFKVTQDKQIVIEPYYIDYDFEVKENRADYKGKWKLDGMEVFLKSASFFDEETDEQIEFTEPETEVLFKALDNKIWIDGEIEVTQDDELPSQRGGF